MLKTIGNYMKKNWKGFLIGAGVVVVTSIVATALSSKKENEEFMAIESTVETE